MGRVLHTSCSTFPKINVLGVGNWLLEGSHKQGLNDCVPDTSGLGNNLHQQIRRCAHPNGKLFLGNTLSGTGSLPPHPYNKSGTIMLAILI